MGRDSSGESLEAILASIRRSLAEQATSALEEETVLPAEATLGADAPGDLDAPPLPQSLSQQLAASADALRTPAMLNGEVPASSPLPTPDVIAGMAVRVPAAGAGAVLPAGAASDVAPAPAISAAAAPAASPEPAPEQKDPLWFLGHEQGQRAGTYASAGDARQTPMPDSAGGMAPLPEPKPKRAPEPRPSQLGVLRGPLPPFFGSSAEVVKVEIAPDPPALSGAGVMLTPGPEPLPAAPPQPVGGPPGDDAGDVPRSGGASGNGLEGPQGWPRGTDGAAADKASSIFGPVPGEARAGEASPQMQALEVMVADLLRPMLRRWLDENMPRLVSAALKAEAEIMSRRDPKKP